MVLEFNSSTNFVYSLKRVPFEELFFGGQDSALSHEFVDHMQDPVLVVGFRDVVRAVQHRGLCVCHGHSQSSGLYHGDVIVPVPAADHLLCGEADAAEQLYEGVGLVHAPWHDLQEEGV